MPDLSNIQGNILRGYASFPHAQFLFLGIRSEEDARSLLRVLLERRLVTPGQWREKPEATLNLALTFEGLRVLGLPDASLATFPAEFQVGMKERAKALGDVDGSSPENWDDPWRTNDVHIMVMLYGRTEQALAAHCAMFRQLLPAGVMELGPSQSAGMLRVNGELTRHEHFGFLDGLSNPAVEGVRDSGEGRTRQDVGNPNGKGRFRKIPVGEFLLGYPGEGGELAPAPRPHLLAHEATYLVFRKLEQDVIGFRRYLDEQADAFVRTLSRPLPHDLKPQKFLAAKMMGRWQNGSSLIEHPNQPGGGAVGNSFAYAQDPTGARCPLGAHVRRANPRDALGFDGKTMSRHRLIRRGIAYGSHLPPGQEDTERRGILFIALNSGFDQFEFVQRNWINFGDDFQQGNDTDPITGGGDFGQMVIPGDEATGRRPFVCQNIPRFVTTKGGDYFFVPSLTAIRLLAFSEAEVA